MFRRNGCLCPKEVKSFARSLDTFFLLLVCFFQRRLPLCSRRLYSALDERSELSSELLEEECGDDDPEVLEEELVLLSLAVLSAELVPDDWLNSKTSEEDDEDGSDFGSSLLRHVRALLSGLDRLQFVRRLRLENLVLCSESPSFLPARCCFVADFSDFCLLDDGLPLQTLQAQLSCTDAHAELV